MQDSIELASTTGSMKADQVRIDRVTHVTSVRVPHPPSSLFFLYPSLSSTRRHSVGQSSRMTTDKQTQEDPSYHKKSINRSPPSASSDVSDKEYTRDAKNWA